MQPVTRNSQRLAFTMEPLRGVNQCHVLRAWILYLFLLPLCLSLPRRSRRRRRVPSIPLFPKNSCKRDCLFAFLTSIQYRVSRIEYPASGIEYPASSILSQFKKSVFDRKKIIIFIRKINRR